MTITTERNNDSIILHLDGWLDTLSAPELGKEVDAIEAAKEIVLDFDKVEYMASSGLRQVVASHRKAKEIGAVLSIINVGTETFSIFKMTGLDKKLDVKAK